MRNGKTEFVEFFGFIGLAEVEIKCYDLLFISECSDRNWGAKHLVDI